MAHPDVSKSTNTTEHASPDVRVFFGLKHAGTGELLRLRRIESDPDSDYDDVYELCTDREREPFALERAEDFELALLADPGSFGSSEKCPRWGRYSRADLVPVKVTVRTELEPVAFVAPLRFNTVQIRDIPAKVAAGYAGAQALGAPQRGARFVFWLVVIPPGETLESIARREGDCVYGHDRWSRRRLHRALPVPDDYVDLMRGQAGALLIAG